jgi:hypothetical protein
MSDFRFPISDLSMEPRYLGCYNLREVRPDMQAGEPCGKCSTPVIKRKGKWKPGRDYYYEFHLICPNCQTTYHVESAKRFVEQSPSLF